VPIDWGLFALIFRSLSLLKDYRQKHPEVTVLDPPDAIQHLYNRQSMLQHVADLNLPDCHGNLLTTVLLNRKKYLFLFSPC
jgi:hypothetical protein